MYLIINIVPAYLIITMIQSSIVIPERIMPRLLCTLNFNEQSQLHWKYEPPVNFHFFAVYK